jgi:uncharacterized protein
VDDDLRRRLRRLGVTKGLGKPAPGPGSDVGTARAASNASVASPPGALPGGEVETEAGTFWLSRQQYTDGVSHGRYALSALRQVTPEALGLLGVPDLGPHPAFLDIETTGLGGGAGTLAFLVGVGVWDGEAFDLHLIFMRDPGEEPAALAYLTEVLSGASGLVTFNGRGFDVPILETRYVLNRMAPTPLSLPHLDLLSTARQLWRDHLPSRRLGELEMHILDVVRTEQDLDSGLIPTIYRTYLDSGDPREIARVFYHNQIDVLSLAALLAHVSRMVVRPDEMDLAAAEWVGVGRVYDCVEQEAEAFAAWQRALAGELEASCAARIWQELGVRYKRREAWTEALAIWDAWIAAQPVATAPLVEKAKYYEWVAHDLSAALRCSEMAISRAGRLPKGFGRLKVLAELDHRHKRLVTRLERLDGDMVVTDEETERDG